MAYGVSEERIRVISEAGILKKASQESIDEIKEKYKISGDYLLAFASGPYKNIQRIKKAYEMATAGKNLKLVVVGRQSVNLIKEDRNVRLTGYVKEDELAALLTGSRGLIFASLYEGFGQPILEAFSCEVPVVTSNLGSMREVAGEAAALVDPKSEISISEGIEAIIRGPKKFIEKGKKRVKDFSWEKTAAETLKIYKE
jgi:glycosyltransferase involved in cell wall biosynthesis